jgi:hypothetical protein
MTSTDLVIRWSTAGAVVGVAAVAAVASYEHAYDLVRMHGESSWTARLVPLTWLAREFAPHRISETIRDLAAADHGDATEASDREEAARKIAECDRKLTQYRAALDAGEALYRRTAEISPPGCSSRCGGVLIGRP